MAAIQRRGCVFAGWNPNGIRVQDAEIAQRITKDIRNRRWRRRIGSGAFTGFGRGGENQGDRDGQKQRCAALDRRLLAAFHDRPDPLAERVPAEGLRAEQAAARLGQADQGQGQQGLDQDIFAPDMDQLMGQDITQPIAVCQVEPCGKQDDRPQQAIGQRRQDAVRTP